MSAPTKAPAAVVPGAAAIADPIGVEDAPIFSAFGHGGRRQKRERSRRFAFGLAVAVLALAVATQLSNQGRGARGPGSSSYATSSRGLAAVASLLERNNTPILRLTKPIDEAWTNRLIGPEDTLVVLDQDLSEDEVKTVQAHLFNGGQLAAGGRNAAAWMSDLITSIQASGLASEARVRLQIVPGAKGAVDAVGPQGRRKLATVDNPNVFEVTPERAGLSVVASDSAQDPVILRFEPAAVLLADTTVLANATLATDDNAAFALELLTPNPGGRIVFAEAGLGFRSGRGAGLAAVPGPVRTLLLGLVLAALVWMLAVGRRIGEPDRPDRPLPPGRYEHVAAVAGLLERTSSGRSARSRRNTAPPKSPASPPTPPTKDR